MKKAAIIGFGRFGELFANLVKESFDITIIEPDRTRQEAAQESGYAVTPMTSITEAEYVFLAVPISQIESTVQQLAQYVDERHVIVDLCSVKVYPAQIMQRYLTKSALLATHPMFGPDSAKGGIDGLQVAFCPVRITEEQMNIVQTFWEKLGAVVTHTTPEQHDKDAVYSQALTYSVARIILNMDIPPVDFQTHSFAKLIEIAQLSANDSEQLFHDMLFYNPYFSSMKKQLEDALRTTEQTLNNIENEQTSGKISN